MHWKNDWTGFFILYFKWGYYLCVIPFRLEWSQKERKFRLGRNWFQSILCGLQYLLLGFWYINETRKIPVNHLYKDPVVYFTLAFNLNAAYHHIFLLIVSFWRRQERFLALVNFDCEGYAKSTIKVKFFASVSCFLFTILPLLYTISGHKLVPSTVIWDPSMLFRCLVVKGRSVFFLQEEKIDGIQQQLYIDGSCNNGNPPQLGDISVIDGLVGVIAFLMEISRQIIGFYADFFPLICCFSLWTSTGSIRELLREGKAKGEDVTVENGKIVGDDQSVPYNFEYEHQQHQCRSLVEDNPNGKCFQDDSRNCETSSGSILLQLSRSPHNGVPPPALLLSPSPTLGNKATGKDEKERKEMKQEQAESKEALKGSMLLKRYEVCKAFSNRVNKALGQLLFAYVFSSIMYLSTCMDAVLVLEDWFGKLRVAFFFSVFIIMFFVGSEIVNQVYAVREWLSEPLNNAFLPERRLLVLIHEITFNSIGVSGNGMFTVSYSTFKTVMTTTVTFFIIILQFQKPNRVQLG